ncbi:hypothetical protein J6590_078264 [Homalodisca vitripennis]|nr:hypothetical protein J6590_078264 [Homalodisca vitripennis]
MATFDVVLKKKLATNLHEPVSGPFCKRITNLNLGLAVLPHYPLTDALNTKGFPPPPFPAFGYIQLNILQGEADYS